jgi:hypothetical protein
MTVRAAGPLVGVLLAAALAVSGCTPGSTGNANTPAPAPSPAVSSSPAPDAGAPEVSSLEGLTADTPECQPASQAVVDAVNATIDHPYTPTTLPLTALVASPDPDRAVWMLTGVLDTGSSSDGILVSWATTSDPTAQAFTGALRAVGGTAGSISSAPVLQFADGGATGGPPASATRCAPGLAAAAPR